VLYRLFVATIWAGLLLVVGSLALWLLAALELPPQLQRYHPMTGPASTQFEQTRIMFLAALAICGSAWGALLPARSRYSERKLRELEATAKSMALLWILLGVMIMTVAFLDDRSIWLFGLLCAAAAGGWLTAAAGLRILAVLLVRSRRGREPEAVDAIVKSECTGQALGHPPSDRSVESAEA
jgi:hypothetical protein